MYISVKPVEFTDKELEILYDILDNAFDDFSDVLNDENPYTTYDDDTICEYLNNIKAIMLKIADSGLFEGGEADEK